MAHPHMDMQVRMDRWPYVDASQNLISAIKKRITHVKTEHKMNTDSLDGLLGPFITHQAMLSVS